MKSPWIVVAAVLVGFAGGWIGRQITAQPESGIRSPAEQARLVEEAREQVRQDYEIERAKADQALKELQPTFDAINIEKRPGEDDASFHQRKLDAILEASRSSAR